MPDNNVKIETSAGEVYGAEYYASHCGLAYGRQEAHWGRFFSGIAEQVVRSLRPRRAFDAGCAHGFLVEALWDRGVETWGRDISHFAVAEVRADLRSFISQGSIADPIEGEYDLVICIEVLEHMEEAEAVRAIAAMAAVAPRLLFSSSPTDLDEPTHVNVKPVAWWLRRFAEAGLAPAFDYDASFLTPHAYLLERSAEGRGPRELGAFAELIRQRMLAHERGLRLTGAEQVVAQAAVAAAAAERAHQEEATRAAAALADAERARQQEAAAAATAGAALAERARLEAAATRASQERDKLDAALARDAALAKAERMQLEAAAIRAAQERDATAADMGRVQQRADAVQAERDMLFYSATWRATRPLRRAGEALPASARRTVRRLARAGYWLATLQFGRRMAEWRAAQASLPAPATAVAMSPAPVLEAPPEPPLETEYDRWVQQCDTLTDDDRVAIRTHIDRLSHQPLISVVMPVYETSERLLREAIASVRAQLYPNWELCIADDASPSDTPTRMLMEAAAEDQRIKWIRRDSNGNIAAATNSAIALATGEFVALMDHDDLLAEQALYEVAVELNAHPNTDLLYTDEDQVDAVGRRFQPYFKPDWNIDLLLGHNVFSHLGVYRRSLLQRIGGLREGLVDGSQDYDLALRGAAASESSRIRHIPAVLYHWRRMNDPSSFSQMQLDRCIEAAHRSIRDYLQTNGPQAEVLPAPAAPLWTRVRWPLSDPAPHVSLIVLTRDKPELLARCAAGLLHRTDYSNLDVLIVDNDSRDPQALALLDRLQQDRRVRVLPSPGPFNYAALNNAAVREVAGDIVVLLNNDIDVIDGGWLREMASLAMRPEVGAVGAKLLYGDGRIQHAGVVLGVGTHAGGPGVAGHFGLSTHSSDIGYYGQFGLTRELSAVTGACLALRKEVYQAVGGMDAEHLPVSFNDVDLCLRIREHGLRVIWTPFAELYHMESASRGQDQTATQIARAAQEADTMRGRWGTELDNDPFYNPNFDRGDHLFHLSIPPRRERPWRQHYV